MRRHSSLMRGDFQGGNEPCKDSIVREWKYGRVRGVDSGRRLCVGQYGVDWKGGCYFSPMRPGSMGMSGSSKHGLGKRGGWI